MIASSKRRLVLLLLVTPLVACAVPLATQQDHAMSSPTDAGTAHTPTAAPLAATRTAEQTASEIDSYLSNLERERKFGGAVLVARGGSILISKGYGMADAEKNVPNTPRTIFLMGSMSKQFTAMAVLILEAQGKLNVQDRICRYVPNCPSAWQEITIHHLLTHTSGIQDFPTDITSYTNGEDTPSTPLQIIALFQAKHLRFQPGEMFGYSSPGYILLGYIVEQVSKQSFGSFLRQQIFEPLKMEHSGYACSESDLATGYYTFGVKARLVNWPIAYSVCATAEDLYRWDQALSTQQLVPKESLNTMFTPYVSAPSFGGMYGYGWFIGEKLNRAVIGHAGLIAGSGFSTFIERYPNAKVTTIVLSNQEDSDVSGIATTIDQSVLAIR